MSRPIRWDFIVALADNIAHPDSAIRLGMTEDRIAHAVAICSLMRDHGVSPDMVESLCYATDDPARVLALMGQGLPTDYILAMGGAR